MAKRRETVIVSEPEPPVVEAPRPGLVELPEGDDTATEDTLTERPRWRVSLVCPTPLQWPTLEVEAENEAEARAAFCEKNGISGSVHTWTVERIA